jgi:rod shape-determining protein MreC
VAGQSFTRRRVIALLALTSLILVTLDLRDSGITNGLRDAFAVMFRPIESATRVITNPIRSTWNGIVNYDDVAEENRRLKDLVARQEGATIANIAGIREAQELLALNGLPTLAGIESCTAQVVGSTPSNFSQTVEINRGRTCGIRVGMPVLNAAGLIGKVTEVYNDRAVVMLITDPAYSLSVKVVNIPPTTTAAPGRGSTVETTTTLSTTTTSTTTTTIYIEGFQPGATVATSPPTAPPTLPDGKPVTPNTSPLTVPPGADLPLRETGALEGRGLNRLPIVRFIENQPRFGEIAVGSPVISAGGATSLAPPDIVVGTVARVVNRSGNLGPILEVTVAANLENLNFVRILLYQPTTERIAP